MTAYSTLYHPSEDSAECEHFFPIAEELGYDPEAWIGPNPADCTRCGISFDQHQEELAERFNRDQENLD